MSKAKEFKLPRSAKSMDRFHFVLCKIFVLNQDVKIWTKALTVSHGRFKDDHEIRRTLQAMTRLGWLMVLRKTNGRNVWLVTQDCIDYYYQNKKTKDYQFVL